MARSCSVCARNDRAAIDRALVGGEPVLAIARRLSVSDDAVQRHKRDHIPVRLAEARRADDAAASIDVLAEARRCFERVNLLFDACDRFLRDADDPSRYDIGPRASEMVVTYETLDPETKKPKQHKAPLSQLLARLEGLPSVDGVLAVESKVADPRELALKAVDRLRGHSELYVKIVQAGEVAERLAALEAQLGDGEGVASVGRA